MLGADSMEMVLAKLTAEKFLAAEPVRGWGVGPWGMDGGRERGTAEAVKRRYTLRGRHGMNGSAAL